MAEVIEFNRLEDLTSMRLAWHAMLGDTSGASFFQTYDWLEAYWNYFGDDQKLRVLVVTACDQPIGIIPLCVRQERYRVGSLRVLTYPFDHWGTWYNPIGPNTAASMFLGMKHLQNSPTDWDLLELRWAHDTQGDRCRTSRAMRAAGFKPQQAAYQVTSSIDFTGSWNDYWNGRSSKWRNTMRQAERSCNELGTVRYIRHRPDSRAHGDGDPAWHYYDTCLQIAENSWQGHEDESTTLSHPRVRDFLRTSHHAAARLGMVDLNLLYIDDRPAAFGYNYVYNGRIVGLRTGFDPQVAPRGAGTVLMLRMIEDSFNRGDLHFDLGVGWHNYKRRFRTSSETTYRFTHYRPTRITSQGLRFSRWAKHYLGSSQAPTTQKPKEAQK